MDWLLAALALFNVLSMASAFRSRTAKLDNLPWVRFGVSLLATELAWVWLPLQALLALLLVIAGALGSDLGQWSMLLLGASWLGLLLSIWHSTRAGTIVEQALQQSLGPDYLETLPADARARLRREIHFSDWRLPFAMLRPGVEVLRDIPYGPHGVRQQLDIYRPAVMPEGGCPVLLVVHGGAFVMGDKAQQGLPLMYQLAGRGWICVSANYRLSPSVSYPTHIHDLKTALWWIREHGAGYGMDTGFVAVTGGSAGGHLAAVMGLTANRPELQPPEHPDADTSIQACIPVYGLYDFLARYDQHDNRQLLDDLARDRIIHPAPEDDPGLWDLASPVALVNADAPPFLVFHGSLDSLIPVNDARVFRQKLAEVSRNPVVYVEYPGAEHGWDLMHSLRTEQTVDGIHRFLEWARARIQTPS